MAILLQKPAILDNFMKRNIRNDVISSIMNAGKARPELCLEFFKYIESLNLTHNEVEGLCIILANFPESADKLIALAGKYQLDLVSSFNSDIISHSAAKTRHGIEIT
jgi:hypothetical protein